MALIACLLSAYLEQKRNKTNAIIITRLELLGARHAGVQSRAHRKRRGDGTGTRYRSLERWTCDANCRAKDTAGAGCGVLHTPPPFN